MKTLAVATVSSLVLVAAFALGSDASKELLEQRAALAAMHTDTTTTAVEREALACVDDGCKFEPFALVLRSKVDDVRLYCARELGRIGDRRALRPLLWRAVHDPKSDVRLAAVGAAKTIGDANLALPLVKA